MIFELFTKAGLFVIFAYLSTNFGLIEWDMKSPFIWILFFFVYDFFYYWGHRLAHTVNFMWSGHLPHHQSEDDNFTVALRQGAFQDTVNFPVFLPMAIMGCPIEVFSTVLLLNKFLQFWVHTKAIGRVPLISHLLLEQFTLSLLEKLGFSAVIIACLYVSGYLLNGSKLKGAKLNAKKENIELNSIQ